MSFELPPNKLSQADLDASNMTSVYVAVAVGFALATGSVILRGISRGKSKATFGWDDYTIVIALILLYALDIITLLSAVKYGLGRHLPAVISTIVPFQKLALANISLWLATAAATKASLLMLYYRLFSPSRRFRVAVYVGAASVFGQWFSLTLVAIFQCRPVAAFWNRTIQGAECIDLPRFTIVSGVLNLLTDVLILCLPIPVVWGLNTTNVQKITLTGIFLLGVLVCAISIVRISKLAAVNYDDPTWRLVDVYLWTTLEDSVGIMSACLPTLRSLFGNFFPGGSNAGYPIRNLGGPSSQPIAKARFNRLSEEPSPGFPSQRSPRENESSRKGLDHPDDNELLEIDKIPTNSLHGVKIIPRNGVQQESTSSSLGFNHG